MCSCICISRLPHCPCKNPRLEITIFIAHIATAGKWYLRKLYILVARFVFGDSAMVVFKRRFSNCDGAFVNRKNTFRWVLKQYVPMCFWLSGGSLWWVWLANDEIMWFGRLWDDELVTSSRHFGSCFTIHHCLNFHFSESISCLQVWATLLKIFFYPQNNIKSRGVLRWDGPCLATIATE